MEESSNNVLLRESTWWYPWQIGRSREMMAEVKGLVGLVVKVIGVADGANGVPSQPAATW